MCSLQEHIQRDIRAREALVRGLDESAAGQVQSLGDFTQFLDEDEQEASREDS